MSRLAQAPDLWTCPDCAFTFDAIHEDVDGGYSCPECEAVRLRARLAEAERIIEKYLLIVPSRVDAEARAFLWSRSQP